MRALSILLLLSFTGCNSTQNAEELKAEPYTPIETVSPTEKSIGLFLSELSNWLQAWTTKTISASTREDRSKQDLLELHLMQKVNERRFELITELQAGPPQNRIVAAGALGFSGNPDVLSPLMAALDDPNPRVVTNALMSIGVLKSHDTPVEPLCEILSSAPESSHRWGAANALLNVLQAGAFDETECARGSARIGLTDEEPMVRAQCAMILGQIVDADSLGEIAGLLYDKYPLVAKAAARSIGYIGAQDAHSKGPAARLLFDALENSAKARQMLILEDLSRLADRNYQLDLEKWREWVERMPDN